MGAELGSVWMRGFDAGQTASTFDLLGYIKPIRLLPIGYPGRDSEPYKPRHHGYRLLSEMVKGPEIKAVHGMP